MAGTQTGVGQGEAGLHIFGGLGNGGLVLIDGFAVIMPSGKRFRKGAVCPRIGYVDGKCLVRLILCSFVIFR